MPNIYNFTYENLEEKLISLGEKKFRTRQIWQWLYEKRVKSFDEMRNLSSELISELKDNFSFDYIEIVTAQRSDSTNKYLFKLKDGKLIETVGNNSGKLAYTGNNNIVLVVSSIAVIALASVAVARKKLANA